MRRAMMIVPLVGIGMLWGSQPAAQAPASMARFAGTWVGTQRWTIENPPPGSRPDQPVTLTIDVTDGGLTGSMKPFLGGEDGATITEATMAGDELRATAVIGRPRAAAPGAPGRGGGSGNWKDSVVVRFTFRNDGLNVTGAADVRLGEVPWMSFEYELSKKRSRY